MRALLLAAGLGTRLRSLTDTTPKCLVPVGGRPLMRYWLDLLFSAGIERILINTHYLSRQVREFCAASPHFDHIDLVHEDQLLGTGGTVLRNRGYFQREPFLVAHADNLTLFDVNAFVERHATRPRDTTMTMMTFATDAPSSCGIVECDTAGVVRAFHEKTSDPPGNMANAAVYIFEAEVVDFMASLGKKVVDLSTEVIPHFVGQIATFHNDQYHRDIGTLESLIAAESEISSSGSPLRLYFSDDGARNLLATKRSAPVV